MLYVMTYNITFSILGQLNVLTKYVKHILLLYINV